MASSSFLPIKPACSLWLGDDCFAQVSEFNGIVRVHIRRYASNAVSYTPTGVGVSYEFETEWKPIAAQIPLWLTPIGLLDAKAGTLFSTAKTAIVFEHDPIDGKQIRFVIANRKQIILTFDQFCKLAEGLDTLERFYADIACGGLQDAQ